MIPIQILQSSKSYMSFLNDYCFSNVSFFQPLCLRLSYSYILDALPPIFRNQLHMIFQCLPQMLPSPRSQTRNQSCPPSLPPSLPSLSLTNEYCNVSPSVNCLFKTLAYFSTGLFMKPF